MIALAVSLEIGVVAEGVEDQVQWRWLQGLGCESFQGYLFSPPLPGQRVPRPGAQRRRGREDPVGGVAGGKGGREGKNESFLSSCPSLKGGQEGAEW